MLTKCGFIDNQNNWNQLKRQSKEEYLRSLQRFGVTPHPNTIAEDEDAPFADGSNGSKTDDDEEYLPPSTVAQPPAVQPPAVQPPVAQPPVAQPPAVQPPAAQPPAVQSPAVQPPVPPFVPSTVLPKVNNWKTSPLPLATMNGTPTRPTRRSESRTPPRRTDLKSDTGEDELSAQLSGLTFRGGRQTAREIMNMCEIEGEGTKQHPFVLSYSEERPELHGPFQVNFTTKKVVNNWGTCSGFDIIFPYASEPDMKYCGAEICHEYEELEGRAVLIHTPARPFHSDYDVLYKQMASGKDECRNSSDAFETTTKEIMQPGAEERRLVYHLLVFPVGITFDNGIYSSNASDIDNRTVTFAIGKKKCPDLSVTLPVVVFVWRIGIFRSGRKSARESKKALTFTEV